MAGKTRSKAAGYHGVQNMKFAPKKSGTYDTALLDMKYAQSINPSALLEAAEQYADNRLVCRVPSDTGLRGRGGYHRPRPGAGEGGRLRAGGRKRPDYHQHRQLPPGAPCTMSS